MRLWRLRTFKSCRESWRSWRPSRANGWWSSRLKANRLRKVTISVWVQRQGKAHAPIQRSPGRKNSLLFRGESDFFVLLGFQLIRWGSPTLCRAICFTVTTKLNVNLTPQTLTETLNNVWPMFGHPTTLSRWDIKLTIMLLIQKLHLEITGC